MACLKSHRRNATGQSLEWENVMSLKLPLCKGIFVNNFASDPLNGFSSAGIRTLCDFASEKMEPWEPLEVDEAELQSFMR